MDSIIEQQRSLHEERECLVEAMSCEMVRKKYSQADQLNADHKIKKMLDRHTEITQRLLDMYADRDGMRRDEIRILGHNDRLNEFDARLRGIRDYYRRRPDTQHISIPFLLRDTFHLPKEVLGSKNKSKSAKDNDASAAAAAATLPSKLTPEFTDEEGGGRFLDLVKLHELYINLPHVQENNAETSTSTIKTTPATNAGPPKIDYITYLRNFDHLFAVSRETKITMPYRQYLTELAQYLIGLAERIKPLQNLSKILTETDNDSRAKWDTGQFPGWEWYLSPQHGVRLNLTAYQSQEKLELLSADRLKAALQALGMKCGGTVKERAARLWQTKYKSPSQLDPKLFVNKPAHSAADGDADSSSNDKYFELARLEGRVYKVVESLLTDVRRNTIDNVQRKQARTAAEREAEEEDDLLAAENGTAAADAAAADDDDDDDTTGILYNPKNLPLGWDNKPIPYWLYKLHGLNLHYKCEICGNQDYRGPKVFQQHFTEWRHAHGMRCLGIPNSAHFHNITKIEDALLLWDKLRSDKKRDQFRTDVEEEFEDSSGNVVNRKMFDDLRRQGLL